MEQFHIFFYSLFIMYSEYLCMLAIVYNSNLCIARQSQTGMETRTIEIALKVLGALTMHMQISMCAYLISTCGIRKMCHFYQNG